MVNRIKEVSSWLVMGMVFCCLLGMLSYQYLVFGVDTIVVHGEDQLSEEEIIAAAHVESQQMLWNINLKQVERNLENLPWIQSSSIKRSLPNQLEIVIDERSPRYQLQLMDKRIVVMDEKGIFLDYVNSSDSWDGDTELIEVPLEVELGMKPSNVSEERWDCLLEILNWKDTLVGERAFRMTKLNDQEMEFWLTKRLKVEVSDMIDGPYIVDMLARIVSDLSRKGISEGTIQLEAGYDARFLQEE
ncbi:hypothetical protein SANA_18340 [Gottschalkiaceae bacterium SANA]|nr:hypothetical protein SANA_18340 [Gottschalkiaceae bacterium SANA]